jgi:SAM-dependent methyltransferase
VAEGREELASGFDRVAELYQRARPTYPDLIFDDLARLGELGRGARVLEVGCGTGQATSALARRGWTVTAVELGASLADVARRVLASFSNVEVVTAAFERWEPPRTDFDAVFAATAWHWLDPGVAFGKAHSLLRHGGVLATLTTHHVMPADGDDFFRDIQAVYAAIGEADPRGGPPAPEEVDDADAREIAASGFFDAPQVCRYLWSQSYTADDYINTVNTYSRHISMTEDQRAQLFEVIRQRIGERRDGRVLKHYLNVLHVAHRID